MRISETYQTLSSRRPSRALLTRVVPWGVEGGLAILLVLTPLALGSVSETATALMEGGCFALFLVAWWLIPPDSPTPIPRALVLLVAAFVGWTVLQMMPLPAPLLRWVAPGTRALYAEFAPGQASDPNRRQIENFLRQWGEAESSGLAPRRPDPTGFTRMLAVPARARSISWYPERTMRWLSRFLAYVALAVLVARYLPERARTRRLPWLLLSLGFGIALLGIVQRLTWNGKIFWVIPVYQGYPFGPWVNNNHFSGYLEMVLPLGGAVLLRDLGFGPRRRRSSPSTAPRRLLAGFMVAMMAAALVMAGSRGGLFSIGLTAALVPLLRMRQRGFARRWRVLLLAALPLVLFLLGILWYTFAGPGEGRPSEIGIDPSFSGRVDAWRGVLDMIVANPVAGTGLGTFSLAYPVFKTYGNTSVWDQAHNEYLQLLAESGLVGFGIGLGALVWIARRRLLPVLSGAWSRSEPAVLGAAIGIVTLLVHSLVDFNLQIPSNGLLFSLLGGILISTSGEGHHGMGGGGSGTANAPKALI